MIAMLSVFDRHRKEEGRTTAGLDAFLPRPVKHDAGPNQQIVLVVVRGVGKRSQIIIKLNDAQREPGIQRHVDSASNASGEFIVSVVYSSHSAAGMRGAE